MTYGFMFNLRFDAPFSVFGHPLTVVFISVLTQINICPSVFGKKSICVKNDRTVIAFGVKFPMIGGPFS